MRDQATSPVRRKASHSIPYVAPECPNDLETDGTLLAVICRFLAERRRSRNHEYEKRPCHLTTRALIGSDLGIEHLDVDLTTIFQDTLGKDEQPVTAWR